MVAGDGETIVGTTLKIYYMELEKGLAKESSNGDNTMPTGDRFNIVDKSPSKLSSKEPKPEQPISIIELRGDRPLD